MFRLRLLGGFSLEGPEGAPPPRLRQRRAGALLALLAVAGSQGCTRDRLIALLWPDADTEHGRHSLRDALHDIRHTLGADALLATHANTLQLNPAVLSTDVQSFLDAAAERPAAAVEEYGGPFLDGVHVDGAPDFARWVDAERSRLGRLCMEALEALAGDAEAAQRWGDAARWWGRAAGLDPYDTRLVVRRMWALARAGDRANALFEGDAHVRRLREDLDLEPDASFTEEAARIRRGELGPDRWSVPGADAPAHAATSSPSATPTSTLSRVPLEAHPLWQLVAGYVLAALVVMGGVGTLTDVVGLPSWVPPLAGLIALAGLPLVVATALVQRRARDDRLQLPLTWRMAGLVLGAAYGLLAAGAGGYMGMRVLGIGPVGTLAAAGVVDTAQVIVLADFETRTVDSTLVHTVTDAFRTDLTQSRTVKLADPAVVSRALSLMERDRRLPLDVETAREVAIREGLGAVIAGEIDALGSGFVLTVRVLAAETGVELAAFRETAEGPDAIIPAVERLSRAVRARIGESLREVRRTPPLRRVRTASLEALRRYTEGRRANNRGDFERAVTLLTEALQLDTVFAEAYLVRGAAHRNLGKRDDAERDFVRAFALRDRNPALGRAQATMAFYLEVTGEYEKAVEALQAYADLYPDDMGPLNNLGATYSAVRDFAREEETFLRLCDRRPCTAISRSNLLRAQVHQGKYRAAEETLRRWEAAMPGNAMIRQARFDLETARWNYAAARAVLETPFQSRQRQSWADDQRVMLSVLAGRLAEVERHPPSAYELALVRLQVVGDTAGAVAAVERWLASLDSMAPRERPYLDPARVYALAGQPARARALLAAWDRTADANRKLRERVGRRAAEGLVALAEGRSGDAIALLRDSHQQAPYSPIAYLVELGLAYEQAGQPDSALAHFARYLETPYAARFETDYCQLPFVYERLAALHEDRGDTARAVEFHGKFVALWANADAALRPRVEAARAALARLTRERAPRRG